MLKKYDDYFVCDGRDICDYIDCNGKPIASRDSIIIQMIKNDGTIIQNTNDKELNIRMMLCFYKNEFKSHNSV